MDCKTLHQDLIFYLDNELPEDKRNRIEQHLEGCEDCKAFVNFLKMEMQIITEEKNPDVSPFFYTRLSAKLETKTEYQTQNSWNRFLQPAFFTIILLIAIYGGMQFGSYSSSGQIKSPAETNSIQLFNDFEVEPIESFLLSQL